MGEVADTGGDTGSERTSRDDAAPRERSLAKMLLWSSVDLDTRGLSPNVLGLAAGLAFVSAMVVLYLLGESWGSLRMVQVFTIIAGLAVGVAGTYDVLTKRPVQILVPLAQLLAVVLVLAVALRVSGRLASSRSALAWSLGLHLCLLPLTTRLWAIFFGERSSGRDVARRHRLLAAAEEGEKDTFLVRVLESDPGYTEAKVIGAKSSGTLRMPTNILSPRPRPGLVYVLSNAVVINRSVPGSEEAGQWARYCISAQETAMLGERARVTAPAESAQLATRALIMLVAVSLTLTVLAAVASL